MSAVFPGTAVLPCDRCSAIRRQTGSVTEYGEWVHHLEERRLSSTIKCARSSFAAGEYDAFLNVTMSGCLHADSAGRYLGADCGARPQNSCSSRRRAVSHSHYSSNHGDPIHVVHEQLTHIYDILGPISPSPAARSPGWRADPRAFHPTAGWSKRWQNKAAKRSDVDYILDIGG